MSAVSVKEFGRVWWSEVYNRIIGAVVFLDDPSAECLHFDGGLFNLLNGGAVAVKSLSPFEFSRKDHKKAVFITQTTATQLRTIHEIIRNSDFTHCILISCVSFDVVYLELNEGKDVSDVIAAGRGPAEATKQLEAMLMEWIGKKQCAVEAVHIPIFTIAPTSVVFLTPPYQHVYPTFDGKLIPDTTSLDLYTLTSEERSQVRRLASGLNSLMESMNLKEDIYYMGAYSSLVTGVLENSPVCLARRKNCTQPASLIIVDRTLDLCGVTSHGMESVLDRVMCVLPRFPGHSNNVAVDMSPLCEANVISHPDDMQLSPGCLFHANDESCTQTFDHMVNKSQKEVMFDLYNKLSKIDVQKSPSPKTLLKVTPQSVEKIVSASKGNYEVISKHLGILQQALGVVQTLKSPKRAQLDLLTSLENQVQQSLAASRDSTSVLMQISQLIKTRKDRNLPLENLLALIVHVYSLTGTEVSFPAAHEVTLTETLSVALFEEHRNLLEGRVLSPEQCDQLANNLVARAKDVSSMRRILLKYNSVLKPSESTVGHEYRGVLQQLVEDLVDTERPEMPDLRHRNEGLKDLLRSGLNILTSKKTRGTKHPLDNSTVIIFVVGGVTAEECKRLHRSVITSGVDNTVLIGSTKFVTPVEAMRDALAL
ncbi:sec1 family domain-containing protein 2-like [Pectinophora gossypiella]|uniref:sec1 family domain-containing protein 2-like n=1 Tax=Pectinophora gossypiella TaxID=13191 RepID=UPI00214E395C|nr:sec1 family domain-containing protein 2-like [Pectinophora gossypiella]